jgi:hypothetical protein
MKITMATAEEAVMDILRPRLVPGLLSSPGIGKSSLAAAIAEKHNLKLIDIRLSQMDPADLNGFPFLIKASNGNAANEVPTRAGYVPMNIFPIDTDTLPTKYRFDFDKKTGKTTKVAIGQYAGWLILLDEFNSAPLAVQAAAYKVVLDRMVGMYKMHPRCAVITAGNLSTDKAIVNRVGTAMQSRLVWLEIEVCEKAWEEWANHHDVDHRVKSFIRFKPKALHKFNPNHNEHTFPCPRTWEFISKIITPWKDIAATKLAVLSGAIGDGMAQEFYAFSKIYRQIPTIAEIIRNPMGVQLGNEPSLQYALSGMISHNMDINNADSLMAFTKRLSIDFQAIILRAAIAKDVRIMDTMEIKKWIKVYSKELS